SPSRYSSKSPRPTPTPPSVNRRSSGSGRPATRGRWISSKKSCSNERRSGAIARILLFIRLLTRSREKPLPTPLPHAQRLRAPAVKQLISDRRQQQRQQ